MSKTKKDVTVVETEAQTLPANNLVNMQLSQGDLVNFVVTREVERLENLLAPKKAEYKAIEAELTKFRDSLQETVLNFAKEAFKDVLKAMKVSKADFTVIPGDRTNGDGYYTIQNLMGHFFIGGGYRAHGEAKYELSKNNVLMIKQDKKFIASFSYDLPEKEFKKMLATIEELKGKMDVLQKESQGIAEQINETKRNSDKIKNKLIEQYLSSTDEGKDMLSKLQNIQFAGKLLNS